MDAPRKLGFAGEQKARPDKQALQATGKEPNLVEPTLQTDCDTLVQDRLAAIVSNEPMPVLARP